MRTTLIRLGLLLAVTSAQGCATLRARSPADASRASLAVLCTDPDIFAPARWCDDPRKQSRAQR